VPAASLVRLHMDPEGPTPGVSASTLLAGLPEPAIESFLALTGPGSGSTLLAGLPEPAIESFLALTGRGSGSTLLAAELRQLGGALGRPAEGAGALPMLDGRFILFGSRSRPLRSSPPGGTRTRRRSSTPSRRTPRVATTSTSPRRRWT